MASGVMFVVVVAVVFELGLVVVGGDVAVGLLDLVMWVLGLLCVFSFF